MPILFRPYKYPEKADGGRDYPYGSKDKRIAETEGLFHDDPVIAPDDGHDCKGKNGFPRSGVGAHRLYT